MRTLLINAILKVLAPYHREATEEILRGYNDPDLIAYAWQIGINVDELLAKENEARKALCLPKVA